MSEKLDFFKKKLLYRASYRGTKEMDILLSSFVNKYIHTFDVDLLIALDEFLKFDEKSPDNFAVANNLLMRVFISFFVSAILLPILLPFLWQIRICQRHLPDKRLYHVPLSYHLSELTM